jgi:ArsR family transcriptional regulator
MNESQIPETDQAADSAPNPGAAIDIDAIHKALANPTRRQILCWLKNPEQHFAHQEYPLDLGVCAGLIDQCAGLSQSTISTHLAILQRAGLLCSRRVGQWVFFKRNEGLIQRFLAQLQQGL